MLTFINKATASGPAESGSCAMFATPRCLLRVSSLVDSVDSGVFFVMNDRSLTSFQLIPPVDR